MYSNNLARRLASLVLILAVAALSVGTWALDWEYVLGAPPWEPQSGHQMAYMDGNYWIIGGGLIWCSNDGRRWKVPGADDPSYSPPNIGNAGAAVVFNGELWYVRSSAVSSSPDGINWTLEATALGWGVRSQHCAVAFDGKIWVMGGMKNGTFPNDVWSSADGVTWTQVTANAGWPGRFGFSAVVAGGKMYVMGGYNASFATMNDVWSSSDGATWVQETASAPWTARYGAATTVVGAKIFVAGGSDGANALGDVWSSTTGASWVEETPSAAWSARVGAAMTSDGANLVLTGGGNGDALNDTWISADGVTWTELTSTPAPWADGGSSDVNSTSEVFDGKLWHFYNGEVWSTSDGENWVQTTASAPWGEFRGYGTAVHDGRLWVLGGHDGSNRRNDVWWSADGATWNSVGTAAWPPRSHPGAVSFNGELWVIGGNASPGVMPSGVADAWHSLDGVTWTEAATPPWAGRYGHGVLVRDNKLWVIGGYKQPPELGDYALADDVWTSSDGQTWTKVSDTAPRHMGAGPKMANGLMWYWYEDTLFASADGVHWNAAASAMLSNGAFAWFNNAFWLFGGDADDYGPNDAVYSVDYATALAAVGLMPMDPSVDSDGDGITDVVEIGLGLDPNMADDAVNVPVAGWTTVLALILMIVFCRCASEIPIGH